MLVLEHEHYYFFNDDGFEVCMKCGVCSSLREMSHDYYNSHIESSRQIYSDVLVNNHLGYVDDTDRAYLQIKTVLKRGYPNISLYAYCAYNTLLQNSVYYSLAQISEMFQINNFKKQYCQIAKNYTSLNSNFDDKASDYIRSATKIFLAKHSMISYLDSCCNLAKTVKLHQPNSKIVFIVCISIYSVLSATDRPFTEITKQLCPYFKVNNRTLEKKIRQFVTTSKKKEIKISLYMSFIYSRGFQSYG